MSTITKPLGKRDKLLCACQIVRESNPTFPDITCTLKTVRIHPFWCIDFLRPKWKWLKDATLDEVVILLKIIEVSELTRLVAITSKWKTRADVDMRVAGAICVEFERRVVDGRKRLTSVSN